jgi:hypothetical protein
MIDDLPPDVRALVSASRARLAPDVATVARLHASVHTAVAAGGAVAGITTVAAKLTLVAKLTVVAVAVTTLGTLAYVHHSGSVPAVAPTIALPTAQGEVDELEVAPRITIVKRDPAPPEIAKDPVLAPVPPPSAPPASLAREVELVDQASQALHRGDHAGVAAAVRSYEVETMGHGQLAEDAAAIALESICVSNDPAAPQKLASFAQRWPHSAQHTRLVTVCHEGDHR